MDKKQIKPKVKTQAQKLKECEKLCNEYLSGWQRTKADFENYKKSEAGKIKDMAEFVKADVLLQALQVYDNLQLAKEHIPDDLKNNEWTTGIMQIESQFKDFLESSGISEIKTENEQFNPQLHDAVEEVESDQEEGAIIGTIQKGYRLNAQVIRPAKVKISK